MPSYCRSIKLGACLLGFAAVTGLYRPAQAQTPVFNFKWSPPESLPPVDKVNQWLDFLEHIALTDPDLNKRTEAAYWISFPGTLWADGARTEPPSEIRYPGIVTRLTRIWRQANRPRMLPWIAYQAERAEAGALLAEIAQEPPPPKPALPPPPPDVVYVTDDISQTTQQEAIAWLTRMGAVGRATLQRLYAQGTVQDPKARATLERLIRGGSPAPPKR